MYQKIMVLLDGSALAECALRHAEAIAKLCGATVELVRVVQPFEIPVGGEGVLAVSAEELKQIQMRDEQEAKNYLEKVASQLKQASIKAQVRVLTGRVADVLVDYIHKSNADLITMATHGRSGVSRWIWGSVADRVLRSSSIPVLAVRPTGCVPGSQA